jgi:hypothetical protein
MQRLFASLLIALICASSAYAQRMYDGSGRQVGRADGLRRMQMIIYFYFFM